MGVSGLERGRRRSRVMMSRASRRRSRVIMSRRQKVMIKALRLAAFILPFSMKGSSRKTSRAMCDRDPAPFSTCRGCAKTGMRCLGSLGAQQLDRVSISCTRRIPWNRLLNLHLACGAFDYEVKHSYSICSWHAAHLNLFDTRLVSLSETMLTTACRLNSF